MKKILVAIASAVLVVVGFSVLASPTQRGTPATPPVDAPPARPIPPETPRREFPIGHPANPNSPRPR